MATAAQDVPTLLASPHPRLRRRWTRNVSLLLGATLLGTLVFCALAAPLLSPYDPIAQDLGNRLASPSPSHLLGTDHLGRDVFTRLLYAARIDLQVGFLGIITPFVVGTVLGAIAGYYGGLLDTAITGLTSLVMAFPYYVLIISLVFVFGRGTQGIYVAVALVVWVSYARIVRGEVATARQQDYVLAARAAGFSDLRILGRHILPNAITQAVVYAMSDIVVIIVGIVTLSYLGLGVPPPTPDWGTMIDDGQAFITTHPHLSTIPGLVVVLTGLALSLLGDGLAEQLKPE